METRLVNILIAEDSLVNQMIMTRMLKHLGLLVDVVSSGSEAVSAVNDFRYDVVFMDVNMPTMDGIEATKKIINSHPFNDRPKIVALTASTLPEEKEKCMEAGMDDFITKPVRLEEVASTLNRWIHLQTRSVPEGEGKIKQFSLRDAPVITYSQVA